MFKKTFRIILPILFTEILFTSAFALHVGAEEDADIDIGELISDIIEDATGNDSDPEPSQEPDPEPSQEPDPEPYTDPEPVATDSPEPVATDPPETEAPETEYIGGGDNNDGNNSWQDSYQKMAGNINPEDIEGIGDEMKNKSVSEKSYSSDNTAGIVSWICVAVGVLVIFVMLVSTKVSGSVGRRGL